MQVGIMIQEMPHFPFTDGLFLSFLTFQFGYLFIVCVIVYFLMVKRKPVIKLFFRESESKELTIPDGLTILIQYSFWIRLTGIMMMLGDGTKLIQWISAEFLQSQMYERQMNFLSPILQSLVGIIVCLWVVWKADWIASKVKQLTPNASCNIIDESIMDEEETSNPSDT